MWCAGLRLGRRPLRGGWSTAQVRSLLRVLTASGRRRDAQVTTGEQIVETLADTDRSGSTVSAHSRPATLLNCESNSLLRSVNIASCKASNISVGKLHFQIGIAEVVFSPKPQHREEGHQGLDAPVLLPSGSVSLGFATVLSAISSCKGSLPTPKHVLPGISLVYLYLRVYLHVRVHVHVCVRMCVRMCLHV